MRGCVFACVLACVLMGGCASVLDPCPSTGYEDGSTYAARNAYYAGQVLGTGFSPTQNASAALASFRAILDSPSGYAYSGWSAGVSEFTAFYRVSDGSNCPTYDADFWAGMWDALTQ
jgi:hypothetical protein